MEKYSVLMSLYKEEHPKYLQLALDSMINQTVRPDEIVLVEDGPLTNELHSVVKKYKNEYPELVHLIINDTNLGLGLALNKGLLACRNELIARMDTDDIAELDRCERQLRFLEVNPDVSVVGGQIEEFIEDPKIVVGRRIVPNTDKALKCFMKRRCPFNHMTVMFKKADVIKVRNYQDWFWNEDYYLWIRLALDGFKFANLSEMLVHTRVGKDMYQRRGGKRYFESEIRIQQFMLKSRIIGYGTFFGNCGKRFIVELLLPNQIRGWAFRKFARD